MKVKELLKTVNVAWSPPSQYPILLAAATAAQQLDASFNTSACLELYSLNLQQPGYDMELKASVSSDHRFHKIIWGSYGNDPAGVIVGGCDQGMIKIYSASKLLANNSHCLISSPEGHTGPVKAMDFNPFQSNLLASGATESEIYIWDLVDTSTPMTPGSKSQPSEDVQYIAWNKQVQHILASTFTQRCVIWDLRKNAPIIKLTDANSKVRWKSVQWHPNVATQLCLASEDDLAPTIELWDLRFATSPLKLLQNHQRGVLSIAWNLHDPDLLISCAKDNRILCWNPNSDAPNGEVICELAQTNQWNFDVSWCPRHPGLVVGSSFDGHAAVYSLLGGHQTANIETSNKIVDSFPGMDPFTQPPPVVQAEVTPFLTKAPKWLKRPFGAKFGFGGKLIIFENEAKDSASSGSSHRKVIISQVITQPDLVKQSNELESALKNQLFSEYCQEKIEKAANQHSQMLWSCINAYFGDNVSKDLLNLLGYNTDLINNELNQYVPQKDINEITEGVNNLDKALNGDVDGTAAFNAIAEEQNKKLSTPPKIETKNFNINTSNDEDGLITQAILVGNIEAAVSLCLESKRYADAIILSMAGGPDLLARTQYRYFSEHSGALNSLMNSLVSESWIDIVKNSDINCWKEVLVALFTYCDAAERIALCDQMGDRLAVSENPTLKKHAQICYICSGNINKAVETSDANIQETVELIMILQKALELQGNRNIQLEGNIAKILSEYAEMLVSEGNLESALNYLGNSKDERVTMLRHRLYKALGYTQEPQKAAVDNLKLQKSHYDQSQKASQNIQHSYSSVLQTPSHSWNTTPMQQAYRPPVDQFNVQQQQPQPQQSQMGISGIQPLLQQTLPQEQYPALNPYSQPLSSQTIPPPPPSSTGALLSRPSSVGPHSKSKYIIDPSVKSNSPYGQSNFQQNQIYGYQQTSAVPGLLTQNTFHPQASVPTNPYTSSTQTYLQETQETETYKSNQTNLLPSMPNTQSQTYDTNRVPSYTQTQSYSKENTYQPSLQPSGWNDPPIAKSLRTQVKPDFQPQTPILHPLGASIQPEPTVLLEQNVYQEPQPLYNQQQFCQNISNFGAQVNKPVAEATSQLQHATPSMTIEAEKTKLPIPEQHVHLKTVLDELKTECFNSARNMQVRKKIEDVSKKLELLYDSLRENKLSANTLQGLHEISQLIQNGDYTGGLLRHSQLVSGPDFSQIASFMPGIKVLLQCALQLGVYIR
ncbi:protein transport protein Sec31A isoform X2 [Prorops nasuta]|uniref:protein transport protein Sec31A isoform X2 n=1 Tax=Prorops nasuta TaxID=863751 RepID=UPI0034CE0DDF